MRIWTEEEIRDPSGDKPIGDPSCPVCKSCSCYKVCFSGMKGFPDSSSNFGKSQCNCAKHERECGIKHYSHSTILLDFLGEAGE